MLPYSSKWEASAHWGVITLDWLGIGILLTILGKGIHHLSIILWLTYIITFRLLSVPRVAHGTFDFTALCLLTCLSYLFIVNFMFIVFVIISLRDYLHILAHQCNLHLHFTEDFYLAIISSHRTAQHHNFFFFFTLAGTCFSHSIQGTLYISDEVIWVKDRLFASHNYSLVDFCCFSDFFPLEFMVHGETLWQKVKASEIGW